MPKSKRYYSLLILIIIKYTNCQKKIVLEPFIVGGEYAKIHHFPHSAFLMVDSEDDIWICGASILNQRIILTAAHCMFGGGENAKIVVFAGHDNLVKVETKREVIRYITHYGYNSVNMYNDIGLAILNHAIPFGAHIKRVILKSSYPRGSKMAIVAGWGVVNETTNEASVTLKSVRQEIRNREVCKLIGEIHSGMMCAGSTKIRSDRPSEGDSGSALIVQSYYQIGLLSFRVDEYPALLIYTNTTYYIPWIKLAARKIMCMGCPKTQENCISTDNKNG